MGGAYLGHYTKTCSKLPIQFGTAVNVSVDVQFMKATLAEYPVLHAKVHAGAPKANAASSHVDAVWFMCNVELPRAVHVWAA